MKNVLILVLLEDGFCSRMNLLINNHFLCLNPCSIGRWFLFQYYKGLNNRYDKSLNPCSIGRWFLFTLYKYGSEIKVLILVLLEDGFCFLIPISLLILMSSLNPCSIGRWFLFLLFFQNRNH